MHACSFTQTTWELDTEDSAEAEMLGRKYPMAKSDEPYTWECHSSVGFYYTLQLSASSAD
jgi:hypothetical protein